MINESETTFSTAADHGQRFAELHHMASAFNPDTKMLVSRSNDKNIKVTLENKELWDKFHAIGTEMIITKCGR